MKTKELPIQFQISSIKTDEFTIIEAAFDERNEKIAYSLETEWGIPRTETIVCSIRFEFTQANIPFLKVKASCLFEIKKESWANVIDEDNNKIVLPTFFTDHLVVLTLGTLRGILHAKTEGTKFSSFFIPTINIMELREEGEDISISLADVPK